MIIAGLWWLLILVVLAFFFFFIPASRIRRGAGRYELWVAAGFTLLPAWLALFMLHEIQPKLLRLLHEGVYERVGDPTERQANVRIIAATNRDPRAAVAEGRLRQDLYQRLNFLPIHVPPVRDRSEDIPLLLRHALDRIDSGRWVRIGEDGVRFLVGAAHPWPGNVREIEQLAARLAARDDRAPVTSDEIERLMDSAEPRSPGLEIDAGDPSGEDVDRGKRSFEDGLPATLARVEREILETAIVKYKDLSREQLALKLKIRPRTLYKKLKEYGITG